MKCDLVKVALVDDHHLLRSGLAKIIDRFAGYKVILEAGNGKEFIKEVRSVGPPDIVLLDVSMPEMNGYETAEWIARNLPKSKVLVLSMLDNEIAVLRMVQCGARGYILKDSKPAELKEALGHMVKHGFYSNDMLTSRHILQAADADTSAVFKITGREKEFLQHVCSDLTYREIAARMNVSSRTVDNYRDALFEKFDIKSRVGLALFAIRAGYHSV